MVSFLFVFKLTVRKEEEEEVMSWCGKTGGPAFISSIKDCDREMLCGSDEINSRVLRGAWVAIFRKFWKRDSCQEASLI